MRPSEPREFVAFDLETTGLRAETDRVVEIGAVRFDAEGRDLGRFETLVQPGRPMPGAAQAIHGLSDDHLKDAPPFLVAVPAFLDFLGDPQATTLLAHNAAFDAGFLGRELARAGLPSPGHAVTDTLPLARACRPELANHRLDTLARALDLDPDGPHRALADSLRVKGLWLALRGFEVAPDRLVAYPIRDRSRPGRPGGQAPVGWEPIVGAMERGARVRIEYHGGTHGALPREVTPRNFVNRGGRPYLVAYCHLDAKEKAFRLDRLLRYEEVS